MEGSSMAPLQEGASAKWLASWPRLIDFSCGFQANFASGTIASILRVFLASSSRSVTRAVAIDMAFPRDRFGIEQAARAADGPLLTAPPVSVLSAGWRFGDGSRERQNRWHENVPLRAGFRAVPCLPRRLPRFPRSGPDRGPLPARRPGRVDRRAG